MMERKYSIGPTAVQSDVDEALRLMKMSKISLSDEEGGRGGIDVISAIYSRIRDDASRNKQATYTWPQLTALFTGKSYSVCSRLTSCPELSAIVLGRPLGTASVHMPCGSHSVSHHRRLAHQVAQQSRKHALPVAHRAPGGCHGRGHCSARRLPIQKC